jgi:hypothetical protein
MVSVVLMGNHDVYPAICIHRAAGQTAGAGRGEEGAGKTDILLCI